MFSLNEELIKRLIKETLPSFHNVEEETLNIGFGYILYSLVRTLRPQNIVAIGSKAGFTPIVLGIGVRDNDGYGVGRISCYNTQNVCKDSYGKVHFIDPSYSIQREDKDHWYGIGYWDDKNKVDKLWASYNLNDIITHYKITSEEFANSLNCPAEIDMLYLDGDHSYEGMKKDFQNFYPKLKRNALIIAHDVDPQLPILLNDAGGFELFSDLSSDKYEKLRLPIFPGLAIIRKK